MTRCSEALANLELLLEPWIWITNLSWDAGLMNIARVEGYVKMTGIPIDPLRGTAVGEHEPSAIRAAMFSTAQEAIRAVEEAGYRHADHPAFSIGGHAKRDGNAVILRTQATLRLSLREPATQP